MKLVERWRSFFFDYYVSEVSVAPYFLSFPTCWKKFKDGAMSVICLVWNRWGVPIFIGLLIYVCRGFLV